MNDSVANAPATLLLVDDDAMVRQAVAAVLENCGYQVVQACDGIQAFEVFLTCQPDLVITDLQMPRLGGIELLRKISDSTSPAPVIVISGTGSVQDVAEALRLGAIDYLVKPIADPAMLEKAVGVCLERSRLLNQNRKYRDQLEQANREMAEYVRILEQDQQAGRQFQLKLFPQRDLQAGQYHFHHCIVPSLYLSGDCLQYAEYGGELLSFYIADVSGHGVSSAFVTALLHHFSLNVFRETRMAALNNAPSPFASPADVMSYYNRELLAAGIDKHVTMFMAVLDCKTNSMVYSVAGHLPMPILASGDDVRYLEGSGMPLGILREVSYTNYTLQLPDAFTLVLCSDGVLEIVRAKNLIDKEAALLSLVAASDRTQKGVEAQLQLDTVSDAPDDIAIMTLVKSPGRMAVGDASQTQV